MKKNLFLLCLMLLTWGVMNAQGETAIYTVLSSTEVSISGTTPKGSSAVYASTYATKCQLTRGNSMTLTLSGFDGCTITGLTLSMKSNTSRGAGSMYMAIGDSIISSIVTESFNAESWNGAWSTAYVDITPTVTPYSVAQGDSIVIEIAATENSLYCQSFTITYTSEGSMESEVFLSLDHDELNLSMGDTTTLKAIVENSTDVVTWLSDKPAVATVENGLVTAVAEGTAIITASVADKTASCVVNVIDSNIVWSLVHDVADLQVYDQVVIVASDYDVALSTNQRTSNRGQAAVDKSEDKTTITFGNDVQVLTLEAGSKTGTFALKADSGYLYAVSSSANQLKTKEVIDNYASWTISIADSIATIKSVGDITHNWLRYNRSSSLFSCYATGQMDVSLYKYVDIAELNTMILYFVPNSNWTMDNARFAAYFIGGTATDTWADLSLAEGEDNVYQLTIDKSSFEQLIFCRMNPEELENNWNNKWNQTSNLTIPTDGKNLFTLDANSWNDGGGTWSIYNKTVEPIFDTIYYVNSTMWDKVNVYAWNVENNITNANWPGEQAQMAGYQLLGYDVYYYVAEQGVYENVIFNNNINQTEDLVWMSGKYYYNGSWWTYGELSNSIVQSTYTVVGSSGLLGTHWELTDTTNNMTQLEDGTYQLIKTDVALVAGTYEYKVVKDHTWDWCLPAGPNQVLSIDKDGIYTITFILNLSNQNIWATAELQKEAVVIPQVFLIGTMNDWDYTATQLQLAPDSLTASVAVMLNANTTYDYQMVVDGNWFTSFDGTMTRDNCSNWQFEHIENTLTYASLYTDIAGEYTFVWNYADNTVSVIYPDICSAVPELQWYNGIVMSQMQTGWYKLSVSSLTEYSTLTSVLLNNDMYNPVKISVDYYMACEGYKIMQGTSTTFATGVTTVDVNIDELMNYIKYIPNIEFVYLYISIEEVEMGYAYQTITDYVCDGGTYTDPITGETHIISSYVPDSQIWTDTVHVHETLDSIYIFHITPFVAPERLYEDMLWQIGAMPHLVAGQHVDVTGSAEAIMAYYDSIDAETIADVVRVEWVKGADVTLPCDATTHSMTLLVEAACDYVMVFDYVFAVEYLEAPVITVEACGSYNWHGITYTESGEYHIKNEEGCIVEILYLTIHPIDDKITTAIICHGETFLWEVDGKEYTETSKVAVLKENEYGCEITYILDLTVSTAPVVYTDSATICYGDYYAWIDGYYDETGVYETVISNEDGCDSIIATLHLTVLPEVPETIEEITIYDGEEYMWHDEIYTEEGEYSITLQDINGCDSVVILHLTVKPIYEDEWALLKEIREDLITNNAWQTPWDVSTNVSSWRGVELYNGHVIEIDLSSQGLMGTFPTKILQLPHLEYLSLADNQLTGDAFAKIQTDMTTFVATNPTFVSALIYLDISYNQFTGNVGIITAMSKLMPNLSTLQANNNRLKDVVPMIPQKINVDLSEQDIQQYVNLNLSNLNIDPKQIPTILLYNHAGQSYFTSPLAVDITNYVPLYAHEHSDPWGIMIDATNNNLMCLNGDAYRGKNGDTLYLSYPYAEVSRDSYCRMILSFEMGDANFMDGVNITDLQSTILYAFNEYNQCAFNFTAADTYTDDRINVQDVIRTVDILLANAIDSSASTTMSHIAPRTQVEAYEAEIVIENNAIKLITSTPIAALQISAMGDVQWQMNNLAMEQTTTRHAVVVYSLMGNHIPVGETIIGYCQGNVEFLHAELSDTDARLVPVKISGHRVPSALDNIQDTDSEQVIYDVLGRKHSQINQQGLYIIKSDNQYIKVYNNK